MNGACGVLNAVQVAAALLASGTRRVLIVSGDGHPSGEQVAGFPYAAVGGAMLLRHAPDGGFGRVALRDDDGPGVEGFVDLTEVGAHGRRSLTVQRHPEFIERLLDLATATARDCLDAEGVAPALLLAPRVTPDFGARLAARLGLDASVLPDLGDPPGDPHTSTLTLGFRRALDAGRVAPGAPVLMVAAGAGLTAAAAVYRPA
jgi:3-oxoacyl-[acyl-carrier-protein] synthase-3